MLLQKLSPLEVVDVVVVAVSVQEEGGKEKEELILDIVRKVSWTGSVTEPKNGKGSSHRWETNSVEPSQRPVSRIPFVGSGRENVHDHDHACQRQSRFVSVSVDPLYRGRETHSHGSISGRDSRHGGRGLGVGDILAFGSEGGIDVCPSPPLSCQMYRVYDEPIVDCVSGSHEYKYPLNK
jgi:hypothetical protein